MSENSGVELHKFHYNSKSINIYIHVRVYIYCVQVQEFFER